MLRKRAAPFVIGGGVLLLALLPVTVAAVRAPDIANGDDNVAGGSASQSASPSASVPDGCAKTISYDTFNDTDKVTPYAFGPIVTLPDDESDQRSSVVSGVSDYICEQPAGASALVAQVVKNDYSGLNSRAKSYVDNRDTWRSDASEVISELSDSDTKFRIKRDVPAHTWSLYMKKSSGTVHVSLHQGQTTHKSTAAVFTLSDGREVWILLDCHFQPAQPKAFPGVPKLTPKSESPKEYTHPSGKPPATVTTPSPKPSKSLTPKSSNAKDYRQPGDGGKGKDVGSGTKPKASVSGSAQSSPAPVQKGSGSSSTGSSGSGSSSGTSTGGGSFGSPSPSTGSSQAPPNEGGDGTNGGDPGGF